MAVIVYVVIDFTVVGVPLIEPDEPSKFKPAGTVPVNVAALPEFVTVTVEIALP